jgi:hypothetical protein
MMKKFIITLVLTFNIALSQTPQEIKNYFKLASEEFNVPAELLEAIAFVNTRWTHIEPEKFAPSCNGQPPVYGIMGLRDDEWFGHSLKEGAKLINLPVEIVKRDAYQNIRAGAALISKMASEVGFKRDKIQRIEDYKDIVANLAVYPSRRSLKFSHMMSTKFCQLDLMVSG